MEGFNHDSTVNNDDGIEARRFNLFIMRAVCGVSRNIVSVRHSSPPLITEHCHGFLHHPQHNHPLVCVLCVVIYIFSAQCICYLDILADYIKADGGDKCGHAPPRLQMGALYRTGPGPAPASTVSWFLCIHTSLQTLAVEVLPSDLS